MRVFKSTRRHLAAGAIVAAAVIAALWFGSRPGGETLGGTEPESAMEAKAFSLPDAKGNSVELGSFRGRAVLLNFWATWCPPCLTELPSFLAFAARARKELGVETLAVSVDESWGDVERLVGEKKLWPRGELPLTILLDPKGSVALSYGTLKYPETYFIDRNFKVIRKFVGPQDWDSQEIMQWVAGHSR